MNQQQAIAYLQAQVVAANCELQGMVAANVAYRMNYSRPTHGLYAPPYDEQAFKAVAAAYRLHHNQVLSLFQESDY